VLLGSLPVSAVCFGLAYLIFRSLAIAGVVGVVLLVTSLVSNVRFFQGVRRRAGQRDDANAVDVIDVEASEVTDVHPVGDDAPAYVFFAGEGKAVLLVGQWLLEHDEFPSLSFRVTRWADSGKPITVEPRSAEVATEPSTVQMPSGDVPRIAVFDATPATLQQDLDRAFGSRRRS